MFLSLTQHFRDVVMNQVSLNSCNIQVKLLICNMARQPVEQRNWDGLLT